MGSGKAGVPWRNPRARLDAWLRRLVPPAIGPRPPGYIGRVPYLLLLRWGVCVALVVHAALQTSRSSQEWAPVGMMWVVAVIVTLVDRGGGEGRFRSWHQWVFIASDVSLLSWIYKTTKNPGSDIYLLYFLPILTAFEHLGLRAAGIVLVLNMTAFLAVAVVTGAESGLFLARLVFFFLVVGTAFLLARSQRDRRVRIAEGLTKFKEQVDRLTDMEEIWRLACTEASERILDAPWCGVLSEPRGGDQPQWVSESPQAEALARKAAMQCHLRGEGLAFDRQALETWGIHLDSGVASLGVAPVRTAHKLHGYLVVASSTRVAFFWGALEFLNALGVLAADAIGRVEVLSTLRSLSKQTIEGALLRVKVLDAILDELERRQFTIAAVSLVDDYRDVIEMARARNVAPGWKRRSKYGLKTKDILAHVVRTRVAEVIEGWDDRLNPEVYRRFGHESLVRFYVPIVYGDAVVGVIQAGCDRNHKEGVFTDSNMRAVEALAKESAQAVAETRPWVLLRRIAECAIGIIGADSASIHVYRGDRLLLQAGAGKATADFLAEFPPREKGIGAEARRRGVPIRVSGADLNVRHPNLYARGVRAVAAFPLSLAKNDAGVLYIHFWEREHTFTQEEIELEQLFAGLIEGAIQDSLLLDSASEQADRAWTLSRFQGVLQTLASSVDPRDMLDVVAQTLLVMSDADNVILYEHLPDSGRFRVPPVRKGEFKQPHLMEGQIGREDILWDVLGEESPQFIEDIPTKKTSWVTPVHAGRDRFAAREQIASCAVVVLRPPAGTNLVGVLFVNYREAHDFPPEERETIKAMASSAALAIHSARLEVQGTGQLARRERELQALRRVDGLTVASLDEPDLPRILQLIVNEAKAITGASFGFVLWEGPQGHPDTAVRCAACPPADYGSFEEGIVGIAARERRSILVPDVTAEPWCRSYKTIAQDTRSELAVPILDSDRLLGVLNLEHPNAHFFKDADLAVAESLAMRAVIAERSVALFKAIARQTNALEAVRIVAGRVRGTRHRLDAALRLVLTGVTVGEGLGFSRAMIFLTNRQQGVFQGKVAIGPLDSVEANRIWGTMVSERDGIEMTVAEVLSRWLDAIENFSRRVAAGQLRDAPLSEAVKQLTLPAETATGALAAALRGQSRVLGAGGKDALRDLLSRSVSTSPTTPLACVPLLGRQATEGVLIADSEFLVDRGRIEAPDLRLLEAFAVIAATALEIERMADGSKEEDIVRRLRERLGDALHPLGTPVHVLDLILSRLRELPVPPRLLTSMSDNIRRLKLGLEDAQSWSRAPADHWERLDLVSLIRQAAEGFREKAQVNIDPGGDGYVVKGDRAQLQWVIEELLTNSVEAAARVSRSPAVTIRVVGDREAGGVVCIDHTDDGPGIPEDVKDRVFERGYSTKSEPGYGHGLAIARSRVAAHGGTIQVASGLGAHFVVRLPLAVEEAQSRGATG